MRIPLAVLVVGLLAASAPAQTVWVVDANGGPGAHFDEIRDAVDAAADGDVVLVRAGSYFDDPVVVDGKSLTLVADAPGAARVFNGLRVRNLARRQRVVVVGMSFTPEIFGDTPGWGARVSGGTGAVWFADCELAGKQGTCESAPSLPGLIVMDGADVLVSGGTLRGATGAGDCSNPDAPPALDAFDARVALFGVALVGGDVHPLATSAEGGAGARVTGGELYAALNTFSGGAGAAAPGGDALSTTDTSVALTDNALLPGAGGAPLDLLGGVALTLTGTPPTLSVANPARVDTTTRLELHHARPGSVAWLIAGTDPAQELLPARSAPLAVALPALLLPLGVVLADGSLGKSLRVPPLPAGVDATLLFTQALTWSPNGAQLSQPQPIVILGAGL